MTLLELFLIITLAFILALAIRFLIKRISLLHGILSLGKTEGVELESINYLAFFIPKITKRAAFTVRVGRRTFTVRLFSGKGKGHAVHMASEEYAATYMKSGGAVTVKNTPRGKVAIEDSARVYFPRTVIMPTEELRQSEGSVIIFSPAPRELTYVTPAKTAIEVALTGDEVFGSRVFTKTTFINYIDRLSRDSSLYLTAKRIR